jgi:hypothetical protein
MDGQQFDNIPNMAALGDPPSLWDDWDDARYDVGQFHRERMP